jgi:predicted transcriptional regulator
VDLLLLGGVNMKTATVRISLKTREKLRILTDSTGESMQSILDKAVEEISRKIFWERTNSAYATLKKDPIAWKKEQEERSSWEATLGDGLKEE